MATTGYLSLSRQPRGHHHRRRRHGLWWIVLVLVVLIALAAAAWFAGLTVQIPSAWLLQWSER